MHHLTTAINNNCHRHYTITLDINFYKYTSCSDHSIDLCILQDACHELFCVFGDQFLCVMDAGCRGGKIAV